MAQRGQGARKPVGEAVAAAARAGRKRAPVEEAKRRERRRRGGRPMDVFGGELRRRDVFPLLVLHLISREPAYGNRLIEEIEEMTEGVISVNPNTIYPLLRALESEGMIEGSWEHPDKRTRRYYAITPAGRREYRRLRSDLEPFLDSVVRSVTLIKEEIYGG
jgi:PadR family transcriptional regulator, regulatory protein PadR